MRGDCLVMRIHAKDLGASVRRDKESQQESNERGLACAVWSEASNDLALIDCEVKSEERSGRSVVLRERESLNRGGGHSSPIETGPSLRALLAARDASDTSVARAHVGGATMSSDMTDSPRTVVDARTDDPSKLRFAPAAN